MSNIAWPRFFTNPGNSSVLTVVGYDVCTLVAGARTLAFWTNRKVLTAPTEVPYLRRARGVRTENVPGSTKIGTALYHPRNVLDRRGADVPLSRQCDSKRFFCTWLLTNPETYVQVWCKINFGPVTLRDFAIGPITLLNLANPVPNTGCADGP